ncbi:hypothetical protein QKU48_gp0465 [Fadolivirus algeromassiliense]|jgi:hypothetical protein|uniref:Uncharacterized protein n=1 Tax=Fadolivirus FV1/VV64 TaxID=3070911 RepID=A0A7D3QU87_9VIRU|nr:hypothetical protein QKU48_gp0465 [Fadolivirus algeromassiliense]QKF93923.1 hypothetical protein Fadolivirus_1_465 [Fadolivirus FV1/VV64]
MNNILDNIKLIQSRMELIETIEMQSKSVKYIKWVNMSCWFDSALMCLLAYPTNTFYKNILKKDKMDITKIDSKDKKIFKCSDDDIQKIHTTIKEIYVNMHNNSSVCPATDLWNLMGNICKSTVSVGSFSSNGGLFYVLRMLYPTVFIRSPLTVLNGSIENKILNELNNGGILYKNQPIENKLLNIIIDYYANKNNIKLSEEYNIGGYRFKLLGLVYQISNGHIRSFVRDYMGNWYNYDGMSNIYVNLGNFNSAKNQILDHMYLINGNDSVLLFEITKL